MKKKTPLNIERQPQIGSTWIIEHTITGELCKCSATTYKDRSALEVLRKFSGTDPFFTVKIGSIYTKISYLKFFCGAHLVDCLDEKNQWKWLDITQDEADIKQLWYSEPNLLGEYNSEEFPRLPETPFKPIKDIFNPWIEEWINDNK